LCVIAIYYISDYIQESAIVEEGDDNFYGVIWFFKLLLLLVFISVVVFSYEAYKLNRQKKIKERNLSLILIALIVLMVLIFGGYFLQFAF